MMYNRYGFHKEKEVSAPVVEAAEKEKTKKEEIKND